MADKKNVKNNIFSNTQNMLHTPHNNVQSVGQEKPLQGESERSTTDL